MTTETALKLPPRGGKGHAVTADGRIVGAPLLPQVNLIPDSVRARRALQRIKLWLVVVVGVVIIVALLGYVASMLAARSAQDDLETAQAESARLVQEQAKYSEVPQVLAQVSAGEQAQAAAMGTEVLWADAIRNVLLVLPPGAQLMSFDTAVMSPVLAPTMPADQLTTPGIGSLTLTHRSPTVPDMSTWIDALNAIPGFTDAQYTTASIAGEEGQVYYEVVTQIEVSADMLSQRFSTTEAKE